MFYVLGIDNKIFFSKSRLKSTMAHENGDKQRPTKRRHVQGMLNETDPLIWMFSSKAGNKEVSRKHKRALMALHKDNDASFDVSVYKERQIQQYTLRIVKG